MKAIVDHVCCGMCLSYGANNLVHFTLASVLHESVFPAHNLLASSFQILPRIFVSWTCSRF
jgi:hypothetical protein